MQRCVKVQLSCVKVAEIGASIVLCTSFNVWKWSVKNLNISASKAFNGVSIL